MLNNPYKTDEATKAELKEENLHEEDENGELIEDDKETRQGSVNTHDHGEEDEDDIDPDKAEELVEEEEIRYELGTE